MTQLLPQNLPQNDILVPNTNNPQRAVEYINSYINRASCEELNVDISFMNIIDACYVSAMCSASHYVKYEKGKINWLVSDLSVKNFTKDLGLGNSEYYAIM